EIFPARHRQRLARTMLLEQRAQALARAGAIGRDQHALAGGDLVLQLRLHDIEEIARRIGARRREIHPWLGAAIGRITATAERRKLYHGARVEGLAPFLRIEEELFRLDRAIDHRAFDRAGIAPRGVEIADRFQPIAAHAIGLVIERHRRTGQVIEDRLEALIEQRQPMLDADIAMPGADRFVKRIVVDRGAELIAIARAETADTVLFEQHFADRLDGERFGRTSGALGERIEGPDVLDLVAEEIQAQ